MKKVCFFLLCTLIFTGCTYMSDDECRYSNYFLVAHEEIYAYEDVNETLPADEIYVPTFRICELDEVMLDVPIIHQFPRYPTGCESVSTVMALNSVGEEISVDEFVDKHLPKNYNFYWKNGKDYGPNPYEYFLGTPYDKYSWGCMASVIEKALISYFNDSNRIINSTGTDLDILAKTYIANGMPVIVWVTINMMEVEYVSPWYLSDGTLFRWPGNEHCMLLVGMDSEKYYFNDPYTGKLVGYPKEKTEARYEALGKQSIVISKRTADNLPSFDFLESLIF